MHRTEIANMSRSSEDRTSCNRPASQSDIPRKTGTAKVGTPNLNLKANLFVRSGPVRTETSICNTWWLAICMWVKWNEYPQESKHAAVDSLAHSLSIWTAFSSIKHEQPGWTISNPFSTKGQTSTLRSSQQKGKYARFRDEVKEASGQGCATFCGRRSLWWNCGVIQVGTEK